jgi:PAS domain S-box-containing protein
MNYSHADGVPDGGILSIVEDGNGAIWAGGQYGITKLDSGSWRQVGAESGYPAPGAQVLFVDRRGTLWVATDGLDFGLRKDPVRRNTILVLAPNTRSFVGTGESVGQVWTMAEAPDGKVWIAETSGHTVRPIMGRRSSERGITLSAEPLCVLFDRDRSLWIGANQKGLRRVADVRHSEANVVDQFRSRGGLSSDRVYTALEDREGNLWFGTGVGLDRFRENKVTPYSSQEGLASDQKLAVASTPDGSVWLFNYTSDTVQRLRQGQISTSTLPRYSRSDTTRILSLYADRTNHIWLGGSFDLAEGSDGKFSFVKVPDIESGGMVHAITRDTRGDLWVTVWGGDKGGGVLRLRNGHWTDFRAGANLPQYRCRVLYGDPGGRVWLGFENGDVAVHENDEFKVYSSQDGLPGGRVLAITGDRAGNVWIGGESGLSRVDRGRFVTITKKNGLPGNSMAGIVEDGEGFLWLAGELGVLRVDPRELEKALLSPSYRVQGTVFDAIDGFRGLPRQHEPFPTATRAADGRLWFSTSEGVAVIDPRHLPKNTVPPPVLIEAVKTDDRTLTASSGFRLRPRTRDLQFEFVALSLAAPERVKFRYKLDGYDEDWQDTGTRRQAIYANLGPGNYRFRVIASNNDGVWNEEGATVAFSVAAAWYQTWWFRVVALAAFLALLSGVYRLRIQQLRRQERKLRDVIETIPTFAWTALPDGCIDFVNRNWQEYTGLSTEKAAGWGWQEAAHPEDVEQNVEKWRASLTTGEPFEDEVRYRRAADGQYRWFLSRAVPLRDHRGKILKWFGTSTDIEDRKRAEHEREKLREMEADLAHVNRVSVLGELAASVSHELKQPIAAAMTNAKTCMRWLQRDQPDVEEALEATNRIVKDGSRATEIIERLRSLYKKSPPHSELVNVNEIVYEILVLLRSEANRYSISIRTELTPDLPKISADRVQIQQVLMNLMLNAIEAMKETAGELTIKTELGQSGQLLVEVSDTGVGLPKERTEQIFDAFFTTKPQGSGMGLSISCSIVESHGGRLWATDNSPRGARFCFTLPIKAEAPDSVVSGDRTGPADGLSSNNPIG